MRWEGCNWLLEQDEAFRIWLWMGIYAKEYYFQAHRFAADCRLSVWLWNPYDGLHLGRLCIWCVAEGWSRICSDKCLTGIWVTGFTSSIMSIIYLLCEQLTMSIKKHLIFCVISSNWTKEAMVRAVGTESWFHFWIWLYDCKKKHLSIPLWWIILVQRIFKNHS